MWLLSLLWGCVSDHFLTYGQVEKEIEYVYVQDVNVYAESDTGENEPIWVDSFMQPITSNGVDIFWIIDGSGSMMNDNGKVLQGISDMLANLPPISWRLMIISMTPSENINSTSFPLILGDGEADAVAMFSANVNQGSEYGFSSLHDYIEENQFAQNWLRDDAALLAVFVSDEDDQSTTYFHSVNSFANWLDSVRNNVFVSSIVHLPPDETDCITNDRNTGYRYIELTNMYAGQVLDICSDNWSQGVADAANQIQPHEYYDLSRVPLNGEQIYIFVDGQPFHDFYYKEAENRVYFDVIPDEQSLVEIAYYY
mgnify:FL=1